MSDERYLGEGSRLTSGPAETLAVSAFAHELTAAPALWKGLGHADLAHLAMLLDAEIVGAADAGILFEAFGALQELDPSSLDLDPAMGDVYQNRDRMLEDRIGSVAGLIHAGRARREATTVAWHLACRERLITLGSAAAGLLDALTVIAAANRDTILPDFTYLHHAHPTTLAHYLLGFAHPVARDLDRIERAFDLVNRSPGGSGSVNGTRLPIDRRLGADLLECDGIVEHTRDAMWAPDIVIEQMALIMSILTTIDRMAEELQIWTTAEFGFVELDDAHSRTSVIMPQKKNPYALAYLRGIARSTLGTYTGLAAGGLTPTGQPDNRTFAYVQVPAALDQTIAACRLMADVVARATFDRERMLAAAGDGYPYATDLCDVLVLAGGIDNRTAHRVVGLAVRTVIDRDGGPILASDVRAAADEMGVTLPEVSDEALEAVSEPGALIRSRATEGGAGADSVDAMLRSLAWRADRSRDRWDGHPLHGFGDRITVRVRDMIGR
ncbi:argininosuccinate lyase [bacterium]|nr:argininosuccinate lyase [bacterium]